MAGALGGLCEALLVLVGAVGLLDGLQPLDVVLVTLAALGLGRMFARLDLHD